MRTQTEMKQLIFPLLQRRGKTYLKFKKVLARRAKLNEKISTWTSDGKETSNRAKSGDYIIRNQTDAGEEYIIPSHKFQSRYIFVKRAAGGFSEYHPTGKIQAVEVNQRLLRKIKVKSRFYFIAPWGSKMVVKEKDFLACPIGGNEIYRIARKEFFETYKLENS